jgi:outer membrane protein OmpU
MKKVLFATTALIATAGVASADITLSGSAAVGLRYVENRAQNNNANSTEIDNEIDFTISGSGVSDNGIEFGASIDFENTERDQAEGHTGANDGETYISYNGLTITTGDVGGQTVENVADVGYQGTGADDLATAADVGDYDLNVKYSMNGVSMGVSYGSDSEDWGVSVAGTVGSLGLSLALINDESASDYTELAVSTSVGVASVKATIVDVNAVAAANDLTAFGISVGYAIDATTYTFAMSDTNAAAQDPNVGIGFATNLGGGLTFAGGVTSVGATTAGGQNTTQADLGFNMAF